MTHRFLQMEGDTSFTYDLSSTPRSCPRCHAAMDRPNVNDMMVDVCRRCQGIWLEFGMLEKLTRAYRTGLHGEALVINEVREGVAAPSPAHKQHLLEGGLAAVAHFVNRLVGVWE